MQRGEKEWSAIDIVNGVFFLFLNTHPIFTLQTGRSGEQETFLALT